MLDNKYLLISLRMHFNRINKCCVCVFVYSYVYAINLIRYLLNGIYAYLQIRKYHFARHQMHFLLNSIRHLYGICCNRHLNGILNRFSFDENFIWICHIIYWIPFYYYPLDNSKTFCIDKSVSKIINKLFLHWNMQLSIHRIEI